MSDITKCDMVSVTSYDKTAMQDLLKFCEYRQTKSADGCKAAWNMILAKIKDDGLLEREKEQIVNACKEFLDTTLPNEVYEEYYNETYKNKKL